MVPAFEALTLSLRWAPVTGHACHVTARTAASSQRSNSTFVVRKSGRSAPIWALSPCRRPCSPHELTSCSSMRVLPHMLPMRVLARNIKCGSHWPLGMPVQAILVASVRLPTLAGAGSRCTEWTSNWTSTHAATHARCCCRLLRVDGSEVRLRCTGGRLQRRVTCVGGSCQLCRRRRKLGKHLLGPGQEYGFMLTGAGGVASSRERSVEPYGPIFVSSWSVQR